MIPDDEIIDVVFPDLLERDPSGVLARLTLAAVRASEGQRPSVRYVHVGRCGGLLAEAGRAGAHWLLVAYETEFKPGQIVTETGWNPSAPPLVATDLDKGTRVVTPGPSGSTGNKRGTGTERPSALFAIIDEPPGFPPPPASFAVQCQRCRRRGELDRAAVAADLRAGERRTVRVGLAEQR